MKSALKGLKVTVNVAIKADEIMNDNLRLDGGRERRNSETYKGLDLSVSAGLELAESNGDVDLREISDLLHQSLSESIKEQVEECLDKRCSKPVQDQVRTQDKKDYHNTATDDGDEW